jgi:hypothetical protein
MQTVCLNMKILLNTNEWSSIRNIFEDNFQLMVCEIVSVCQKCKVSETFINTLFGDGNLTNSSFTIGDISGAGEDKQTSCQRPPGRDL